MHALLEGKYELGWLPADEIKVGDILLKGDNLVRKVRVVLPERLGYHRFVTSRLDSDVLLGEWEVQKGGGLLVLRDVTPPPPPDHSLLPREECQKKECITHGIWRIG